MRSPGSGIDRRSDDADTTPTGASVGEHGERRGLRVGACQTPEILGDIGSALGCIEGFARQADEYGVDLLVFPECFVQGYLVDPAHIRDHAFDLRSAAFASVLRRLQPIAQALVIGVIEQQAGRYFNTAAVVTQGRLVGVYRKTHLVPGESLFAPGDTYPTFTARGVRFGVNICYDTQFADAAASVAAQGAHLLLVPAQNMMRRDTAHRWKDEHHRMRAERARETGMWLVSADVTGERDDRIGYGPTSVINPRGEVVAQVPLMTTGIVVADIP
ncbi:carbon-nitrogen hydrolase family protein [Actinoplanes sp. ATCC 53533]|uniref:carbon-nitrogen hydrolase family protein n=1 Tax=Actinoplanes sp. ATCC 53533 TaxID=1288362 RepID=UPI000F79288B|nr:carbon-nitrogen hydrolase family protein [Actinoplanes sp. ATCC 53533]RSM64032.1 carbon-nitrogen hydrolase family protein [Actinoplanes sp. ATCC 53533]